MGEPATVLPQYDATNSVRLCNRCEQESGLSAGADRGDCACAVCGGHHAEHIYPALSLITERDRYREALELIAQHAALDFVERGVAEAERYEIIACDALELADVAASQRPRQT